VAGRAGGALAFTQLRPPPLLSSPQAQLALGASSALATLVDVLRRCGGDLALVRPVLECLAVALAQAPSPPTPAGGGAVRPTATAPSPGAINAELFARIDGSLALVLGLLSPDAPGGVASDFGARYYAARTLAAVAAANPGRAVGAVLAAPAGVGRVMDLVSDAHDAVRAEALGLALALARASPDVQQVAVLEGGLERLLDSVAAQGGVDGGAGVQDAADLLAALLGGHAANGTQFREAGHLARLLPLVRQVDPAKKPSPQQAANLGAVLGVVHALVAPPPPGRSGSGGGSGPAGDAAALAAARRANQDALVAAGGLPTLVSLCLDNGGMPDEGVRLRAMATLAALTAGCPAAQAALGGASISVVGRALPLVQALLRTALRAPSPAERVAGDAVLAGLCQDNADGQAALAATISPVEKGEGDVFFRGEGWVGTGGLRFTTARLSDAAAARARDPVQAGTGPVLHAFRGLGRGGGRWWVGWLAGRPDSFWRWSVGAVGPDPTAATRAPGTFSWTQRTTTTHPSFSARSRTPCGGTNPHPAPRLRTFCRGPHPLLRPFSVPHPPDHLFPSPHKKAASRQRLARSWCAACSTMTLPYRCRPPGCWATCCGAARL
jgi:hypothetical protein